MSDVKRWTFAITGRPGNQISCMVVDERGGWVQLEDYEAVCKRLSDTSTFELKARTAETLDAERYRYLRNAAGLGDDNDGPSICSGLSDLFEYHFGPECDEVVDAAMDRWKAAGCPLPKEAP